jgi:GlcNAc-P-P-Und epimerase
MSSCVLFGGSGFIGTHLARHFLAQGRFTHIHIADIRPTPLDGLKGISYSQTDVRQAIPAALVADSPEWIFNLAAIHREPGHEPFEYYDTNIPGARHVCAWADAVGCRNLYFTSSIAVYGPTDGPTAESSPIRPNTAYGGSKYPAEMIHEGWLRSGDGRRLLISRPGVVYGPGDPGNIMRMIKAIRKGYFAYPGSPDIHKSYAYIYGLIDSVDFLMNRADEYVVYNYVETPTQSLREVVENVKQFFHCKAFTLAVPLWSLLPVAGLTQMLFGSRSPIHPVRVRKAATPTHIIPETLLGLGFRFKYDFLTSLQHWMTIAPEDFGAPAKPRRAGAKLRLVREGEGPESLRDAEDRLSEQEEVGPKA